MSVATRIATRPVLEVGQRLDPLRLALVAVDRGGVDAVLDQLLGEAVRAVLGAGEDQRLVDPAGADEVRSRSRLRSRSTGMTSCSTSSAVVLRGVTWTRAGVMEDAVGQRRDVVRERRREQQVLPLRREQVDDPADVADEAHVEEAVGLVEDEDLDPRQVDGPLRDVVEQAARAWRRRSRGRRAASPPAARSRRRRRWWWSGSGGGRRRSGRSPRPGSRARGSGRRRGPGSAGARWRGSSATPAGRRRGRGRAGEGRGAGRQAGDGGGRRASRGGSG